MKKAIELLFLFNCLVLTACKVDDPLEIKASGYPKEVAKIIVGKCATTGCHTPADKAAASNLSLSTWDQLFMGASSGSAVIPGRPNFSPLFTFCNTYSDLGVKNVPTMPVNRNPLSVDELLVLRKWIESGAPDANGQFRYTRVSLPRKAYVTNQGCDIVAVMDPETRLNTKYLDVGILPGITESPHQLKLSPDGKYFYVTFIAGTVLQKFSTETDELIGNIEIGSGNWNTMAISEDGKKGFVVDWSAEGVVQYVDLETLKVIKKYQGQGFLSYPHGSYLNKAGTILYLTAQPGNFIYKLDVSDPMYPFAEQIPLQTGETPDVASTYDGHELFFLPDESKYFVTCSKSNEVRVFETATDQLLQVIPVGAYPLEFAYSPSTGLLFVACEEDDMLLNNALPIYKGVVSVIDARALTLKKHIYSGFQPHGIAVDEKTGVVWVANRNVSPGGPAPHHTGECNGKNGYVTFIDLATLELLQGKHELSVDPYFIGIEN